MDGMNNVLALQELARDGEEVSAEELNEANYSYSHGSTHCGFSGLSLLICR